MSLARAAAWWGKNVGGEALPAPKPLQDLGALAPPLLGLIEVTEQVALELEAVLQSLAGAEPGDELRDGAYHCLLGGVHQDSA